MLLLLNISTTEELFVRIHFAFINKTKQCEHMSKRNSRTKMVFDWKLNATIETQMAYRLWQYEIVDGNCGKGNKYW